MHLNEFIDDLGRQLAVAADAGGPEARALADRLTAPLESAARLILLEVLAAAADEITRDLAPGSVEVRLRGRDPEFVVVPAPPEPPDHDPQARPVVDLGPQTGTDDGGTSRITLRLPDHLKPRIDDAAAREGLSVNAWLVRAVAIALDPAAASSAAADRSSSTPMGRRYTGWVQ